MGTQDPRLPAEFITAVAAHAAAASAAAGFAAGQVRSMALGHDRERLLTALLTTPFRETAPPWLLDEAVTQGLNNKHEHGAGSGIKLAASALTHADCTDDARSLGLRRCTEVQLADSGSRAENG